MAMELTKEQLAAVNAPVNENLVSAAAGSGKTKVLSERVVTRIKSGDTSIDRLLIVTFTRAAALQMRERIAKALEEEYKRTKLHSLRRQLSMIAGAEICTIDSFCINLVKRNFYRVDVAPDFIIADKNEMKILREEVLIDVLEQMYAQEDEGFKLLSGGVGNQKSDDELKDIILKAYMATRAYADPDKWLNFALRVNKAGSKENDALYKMLEEEISDALKEVGIMIDKYVREAENSGIESYISVLNREKELFDRHIRSCAIDNLGTAMESFSFGSFSGGKRKSEEGMEKEKKHLQKLHKEAKDLYKEIEALYATYSDERGVSYPKIEALVRCVQLFDRLYNEEKRSRKVLEFSDCEYLALKILNTSEDVCNELRDKYDEIYIDEYQDTNPLQDELFLKMSRKERGEANLFIVGDVKQSIYRFRHSDPRVFAYKAKTFGKGNDSCKMILSKNFRSRREIIQSVNCVFEWIMREGTAQVEYDEEHVLKHGADYYIEYNQNKSELYILKNKYEDNDEDALLLSEQRETVVAATKIKEMVESGFLVSDGKMGMRPVRYSDFAVLSSKINNKAEAIMNVFNLMGVPVYCESSQNFFTVPEVQTVVSVLRCVDNPLCDIPLASTMRSPIFAFTENELAQIRTKGRSKPYYENVVETATEKSRLGRKCKRFLASIDEWREIAQSVSVEKLITKIIDESGYYSFAGALPGGNVRQANLRRFMALATEFEKNRFKGLYNFVRYIDKTIELEGEIDADVSHSDDSVLVASIHKSKGLEFPVCIVIGCGWSFNDKDSQGTLVLNPEYGMAIAEREKERRVKFKTAEYTAIASTILRDNHAEQMRLLYVAMTRAKEKLIMIGSSDSYNEDNVGRDEAAGKGSLSDYRIRKMKNYLDYLCPAIDEKHWDVHFVSTMPSIAERDNCVVEVSGEHKIVEEVIYRLSYVYPYDGIKHIPSKMSVSEIKKMSTEDEESAHFFAAVPERRVPSFMKEKEVLKGANRGTAYHRVMELIDLKETNVIEAIEGFVEKGFMTREQAECIDKAKIEKFLASPIAEKMRKAKRVMREESFTIMIDAKDVYENGENEKICVQGTIDCLIEEENGDIILLDYKTDTYSDPDEMVKRYKKQLDLYEVAVFNRMKQNCAKKCLYMFQNGDIIDL
ncbi:MAG: helicase-exonuclease AddAB subunit AddA [Clostridia bacterium]|nr:helicase-exonuclease AddAB subunit AddA [Clostridia bacterium]